MHPLEKRIAVLESATTTPAVSLIILRCLVSPGTVEAEIHCLRDNDGTLWTRKPGETEQELIDRASLEVKCNAGGVAMLIGDDGVVVQTD